MPRPLAVLLTAAVLALAGAAPATAATKVKLYFTAGEQFETVDRTLAKDGSTLLSTLDLLMAGPTSAERKANLGSQIPKGTEVDGFEITGKGTVLVDLSTTFLDGIPADPAQRTRDQASELRARLAQVIYTVSQFGTVKRAKVVVDGKVVDASLTRKEYQRPKAKAPLGSTTPPSTGPVTDDVRALQQRLADLGYLPADAVDGKAGYRTSQAVLAFQAWNGLGRDGVAGPQTKAALQTATRPTPTLGGPARRIEVYRDKGVALLVSVGKVVRAIHVSTGAGANATPPGRFKVFRKELRSWSIPFKVFLPYASYFNNGIAFHEYPDVPAVPASHGCVRVPAPEAPGVYRFASMGTTVVVA